MVGGRVVRKEASELPFGAHYHWTDKGKNNITSAIEDNKNGDGY
jgi:hypothetical protein